MTKTGRVMLGTIQPQTFAQPEALYGEGVGRCVCQDTIRLRDGEWTHPGRGVWCRQAA